MITRGRLHPGLPATKRLIPHVLHGSQELFKMIKRDKKGLRLDKYCKTNYAQNVWNVGYKTVLVDIYSSAKGTGMLLPYIGMQGCKCFAANKVRSFK